MWHKSNLLKINLRINIIINQNYWLEIVLSNSKNVKDHCFVTKSDLHTISSSHSLEGQSDQLSLLRQPLNGRSFLFLPQTLTTNLDIWIELNCTILCTTLSLSWKRIQGWVSLALHFLEILKLVQSVLVSLVSYKYFNK